MELRSDGAVDAAPPLHEALAKSLKGSETEHKLKDAFAGESQANRRYRYFANQADIEGQNDVAALFHATAAVKQASMRSPTGSSPWPRPNAHTPSATSRPCTHWLTELALRR